MPKHRKRRLGAKEYKNLAVTRTRIPCTRDNERQLRNIARAIPSACIDRRTDCHDDKIVVVADCPTKGAAGRFESLMSQAAEVLKAVKGG